MKLVSDWKQAYKWFSTQAMVGAISLQATWVNLPPDLKHSIPDKYVTYFTIAIMVFGVVGRLVDQGRGRPEGNAEDHT